MSIISTLLNDAAVIGGIILVAIGLGGKWPLVTGIVLIVLGLLIR